MFVVKTFLNLIFLFLTVTFAQIPSFTHFEKMDEFIDTGYSGPITFVKWDDDSLTDILWGYNAKDTSVAGTVFFDECYIRFYKNVGTVSNPSYKDMGLVNNRYNYPLSVPHG